MRSRVCPPTVSRSSGGTESEDSGDECIEDEYSTILPPLVFTHEFSSPPPFLLLTLIGMSSSSSLSCSLNPNSTTTRCAATTCTRRYSDSAASSIAALSDEPAAYGCARCEEVERAFDQRDSFDGRSCRGAPATLEGAPGCSSAPVDDFELLVPVSFFEEVSDML
jgi:hypothetical protein